MPADRGLRGGFVARPAVRGESIASPSLDAFERVAHAVRFVALANSAVFFVEIAVATQIGSVSLLADSIDVLEDAAVNGLIQIGLAWFVTARAESVPAART